MLRSALQPERVSHGRCRNQRRLAEMPRKYGTVVSHSNVPKAMIAQRGIAGASVESLAEAGQTCNGWLTGGAA